jgi:hypothetical protein
VPRSVAVCHHIEVEGGVCLDAGLPGPTSPQFHQEHQEASPICDTARLIQRRQHRALRPKRCDWNIHQLRQAADSAAREKCDERRSRCALSEMDFRLKVARTRIVWRGDISRVKPTMGKGD